MKHLNRQQLIDTLQLEGHVEGGYFRQTFKSCRQHNPQKPSQRVTLTSIFYLLTDDSPIGHFHLNQSDIVHYFHGGDPITYYLIHSDGRKEEVVLGPDILAGHQLQLIVEGRIWKASELNIGEHGYALIGEAVAPGFEYADMQLGHRQQLTSSFPQHAELFKQFCYEND